MHQLNQEITTLYKSLKRKEKIGIRLDNLKELITQKELQIKNLDKNLAKELADVTKLEKRNLYTLFQTILGDKDQQLEKERQEYLNAFIHKKGAVQDLAELKEEQLMLEETYSSQFNLEYQLEKLLDQKEEKLLALNHDLETSILAANKRIINHQSKIEEIKQAITEGKHTKKILRKMVLDLNQVEDWGANTSMKKRTAKTNQLIRKVERDTMKANKFLQRYEEELADLSIHFRIDFSKQINTLRNFLDEFVDSLITDWIVKRKIDNAMHLVEHIFDKISRINASLEQEIGKTKGFLRSEEAQKQVLLIKEG